MQPGAKHYLGGAKSMASEISTQHEEMGEGLSSFPMETQEETQQDHWLTTHPTSLALSPIYSPVIAVLGHVQGAWPLEREAWGALLTCAPL